MSATLLSLTEGAAAGEFTVSLGAQPKAPVTITLALNGTGVATVSPSTLTFTRTNYGTPQNVTVAAVDNALVDGTKAALITLSTASQDASFASLAVPSITVAVTSDDTVSPPTAWLLAGWLGSSRLCRGVHGLVCG